MDIRKLMLMVPKAEPETEEATATGNPATFTPGVKKALVQCKVPFVPSQSGSGNPSPSNLRNIVGWNGVHVYHSGSDQTVYETKSISWDTVGEGYVDLATGELKLTSKVITFDGSSDEQWNVQDMSDGANFYINIPDGVSDSGNKCNVAVNVTDDSLLDRGKCYLSGGKNLNLYIGPLINISTVADFRAWLAEHNVQFKYKLTSAISQTLTPVEIKTLKGVNKLWSDSGESLTITYLKAK